MDFPGLFLNQTLLACLSSALAVTFATFVIIDFISDASKRYKTRYIQETAVEYDDVLLQMPPGKIFDLSLALAGLGAWEPAAIDAALEPLPEALDVKKRLVFQAVRVAVCGNMVSPPLGETMALVGREDCLARIDRARVLAL